MKKIFSTAIIAAATVFIGIQLAFLVLAAPHTFDRNEAPSATVAIVLGAKVNADGNPSDVLADRLITAFELYQNGNVDKVLLSGDHGTESYDEVMAMRDFLLEYGVEPDDLFLDHAGFDTYDTMYRARFVFHVEDAIVVTQKFHLPRAVMTARILGIEATGVVADRQRYVKQLQFSARELLARIKATKDLILKPSSTYLGEPIPITGNGQVTWDDQ